MVYLLCLVTQLCLILSNPMDCSPPGSSIYGDSPGKNTEVGCHALLQGIFPTQGLNPGLLPYRWILYRLSHQGNPRILEWVAYPFFRRGIFKWMVHLKLSPDTSKLTSYWFCCFFIQHTFIEHLIYIRPCHKYSLHVLLIFKSIMGCKQVYENIHYIVERTM